MAEAETKNLLKTLTNDRMGVPARPDERESEPSVPVEPSGDTEEGKRPEEVVTEREARPAVIEGEKPKVPAKYKVRIDDGSTDQPVMRELTLEQLAEQGLLDRLITSANQLPSLSRKHQELLERVAGGEKGKKPAETESTKPIDPVQFWNHVVGIYRSIVEGSIKLNIQNGWIEPDAVEAYPATFNTLFTRIFYQEDRIQDLQARLNAAIEWIQGEAKMRDVAKVVNLLDERIEALARKGEGEKGDPLFKDLRKQEVRDGFVEWLRAELDPKIGSLTEENMEKFWLAYTAREVLDFAKDAAKKTAEPTPPKRRAASDGVGTRQGVKESPKEKSLLERMTEIRFGTEA